jgi:hypothetical protein
MWLMLRGQSLAARKPVVGMPTAALCLAALAS